MSKLKIPAGFKVELWASGLPGGRAMALGDDGKKVYLGTRIIGRVYEVNERDGKRTVAVIVEKAHPTIGVAFKDGPLGVFAINKVLRYDNIEGEPESPTQDLTAKPSTCRPTSTHNWKYSRSGRTRRSTSRSARRATSASTNWSHGKIRCYNPDGSGKQMTAPGVRNWWASAASEEQGALGSPTTVATGWAKKAPTTSSTRCPANLSANFGFPG